MDSIIDGLVVIHDDKVISHHQHPSILIHELPCITKSSLLQELGPCNGQLGIVN